MNRIGFVSDSANKRIYSTEDENLLIVEYKDQITSPDGKPELIFGRAMTNNKLNVCVFNHLNEKGVDTHFVGEEDFVSSVIKRTESIKGSVLVRNYASDEYAEKSGIMAGWDLPETVLETDIEASDDELSEIMELALKANKYAKAYFEKKFMRLIEVTLEFGKLNGQIVLAGEFTTDSCRIWDLYADVKLDSQRFLLGIDGYKDTCEMIVKRIEENPMDFLSKEEREMFGID